MAVKDTEIQEKESKKLILPIYVERSVYHDITALAIIESRKANMNYRKSAFVSDKILKPFIAQAKAKGILK